MLLGTFSSFWAALPTLDIRVCAWSYCILLCSVLLMSLGGLLFSWEEAGGGVDLGWDLGRTEGREATVRVYYMEEE